MKFFKLSMKRKQIFQLFQAVQTEIKWRPLPCRFQFINVSHLQKVVERIKQIPDIIFGSKNYELR